MRVTNFNDVITAFRPVYPYVIPIAYKNIHKCLKALLIGRKTLTKGLLGILGQIWV